MNDKEFFIDEEELKRAAAYVERDSRFLDVEGFGAGLSFKVRALFKVPLSGDIAAHLNGLVEGIIKDLKATMRLQTGLEAVQVKADFENFGGILPPKDGKKTFTLIPMKSPGMVSIHIIIDDDED